MADIRVDSYEFDVPSAATAGGTNNDFTITDVGDTSKAFIRIVGSSTHASGGPVGNTGNVAPNHGFVRVSLLDTTTIRCSRHTSTTGGAAKIQLEVWVYTGPVGGKYEFIVRGRGSVGLLTGTDFINITKPTGIINEDHCLFQHQGMTVASSNVNDWHEHSLCYRIDGSGDFEIRRNNTGKVCTPGWAVVEFTGSAWNIGHAFSTGHDTGNDVNGNPATTGNIVPLSTHKTGNLAGFPGTEFDVGDWETAMILQVTMEGDSSETGLSDVQMVVRPDTGNTDEVRFTLDNSNSRNDGVAQAFILQCDDMVVKRRFDYNIAEGNNSYNTLPLITGVDTGTAGREHMALEWQPCTQGEGTAHMRGQLIGRINGSTKEAFGWIHRSGNTVSVSHAIADFSAMVDTGGSLSDMLVEAMTGDGSLDATVQGTANVVVETMQGDATMSVEVLGIAEMLVEAMSGSADMSVDLTAIAELLLEAMSGNAVMSLEMSAVADMIIEAISGNADTTLDIQAFADMVVEAIIGDADFMVSIEGAAGAGEILLEPINGIGYFTGTVLAKTITLHLNSPISRDITIRSAVAREVKLRSKVTKALKEKTPLRVKRIINNKK